MGIPRFDPVLTPTVMYFLSDEFAANKLSAATLKIASLHASGLGLRQLGVPLAAGTLRTGYAILTGTARTGGALALGAARQVSAAVQATGYSTETALYLGRTAFTYYLANAYTINTAGLTIVEISINIGGGDTGGVSPATRSAWWSARRRPHRRPPRNGRSLKERSKRSTRHQTGNRSRQEDAPIAEKLPSRIRSWQETSIAASAAGQGRAKLKPDPRPVLISRR